MDKEERWNLYMAERLKREKENLSKVNPFVVDFFDFIKAEGQEGPLLDLGCGLGRHMYYALSRGFRMVGCDISPKTLELAEDLARSGNAALEFVQCDFMDLPFNNGVFSGVLAIDAIHHDYLENIVKSLREIHRVLATDGLVCLNPISIEDELFGQGRRLGEKLYIIHRIPHYFFTLDELQYILERTYFHPVSIEKDSFSQERDGKVIKREKFRVMARKLQKPRGFHHTIHRPLY